MSDHYDARGRLLDEQDDPIDEHDLDEAQEMLMAARLWIDLDAQRAYGDADLETQILERKYEALQKFAEWLRAFVDVQVDLKIARAIEAHRRLTHGDKE